MEFMPVIFRTTALGFLVLRPDVPRGAVGLEDMTKGKLIATKMKIRRVVPK
jgi:hypothetical protein